MKSVCRVFGILLLLVTLGCKISGTVTDINGDPVEGVQVTLEGDAVMTTTTDSDGAYSFEDLDNGTYTVSAEYEDMAFVYPIVDTKIFYNNRTVNFVEYVPPEPALYDLSACNEGLYAVQLYSEKVENLGLGVSTMTAAMQITQTLTDDGSSVFTCNFIDYDGADFSGYIDGAGYIVDTFPEDRLTVTFGNSLTVRLKIRSLTFTATDNCSFEGTASIVGTYGALGVVDSKAEIASLPMY